jgi:superfamily II DNA/RNA helicase
VFRVGNLDTTKPRSEQMSESFDALGVSASVQEALNARGIVTPFRIQTIVLPDALAGRDILAKSPTGSGKTLAFGIPLVERTERGGNTPKALVLVPTRELAMQVATEIEGFAGVKGLKVALAYGGTPLSAQAKRLKSADIAVATPGRLFDLMERRLVNLDAVQMLVLDEADRMLDMGFRPQVERILRRMPRDRQTMLFSATLDGEVAELAREYTEDAASFEATFSLNDVNQGEVEHTFVQVTPADKLDRLVELLGDDRELALVFVRTKRGADRLVQKLTRMGLDATALHGDMSQSAREKSLARFRSGKARTLVATDVAARGLDLDDISHVINFDPPEDGTNYVHRVGRTGRAGRSGQGITLVLPEQQDDVSRFAAVLGHKESFEASGMTTARPKLVYSSRRGRRSRW